MCLLQNQTKEDDFIEIIAHKKKAVLDIFDCSIGT